MHCIHDALQLLGEVEGAQKRHETGLHKTILTLNTTWSKEFDRLIYTKGQDLSHHMCLCHSGRQSTLHYTFTKKKGILCCGLPPSVSSPKDNPERQHLYSTAHALFNLHLL